MKRERGRIPKVNALSARSQAGVGLAVGVLPILVQEDEYRAKQPTNNAMDLPLRQQQ